MIIGNHYSNLLKLIDGTIIIIRIGAKINYLIIKIIIISLIYTI